MPLRLDDAAEVAVLYDGAPRAMLELCARGISHMRQEEAVASSFSNVQAAHVQWDFTTDTAGRAV